MIKRPVERSYEALRRAGSARSPQAVPPRLVRRVRSSDVFVTDMRVTSDNTFLVGVRLPASHRFYGPTVRDVHDPMLIMESLRQAGLYIAHVAWEIPTEFKFITHENWFDVTPDGLRTNGDAPVDLMIAVTASDVRRRGKGFAGALFEFECFRGGALIASAAYRWSCVSAAGYARLRGERLQATPPLTSGSDLVSPQVVGRTDEIDVMLAKLSDDHGWEVCVDPDHPVVFDHCVDHVPGNAVIEVARQAALLAAGQPDALPIQGEFSYLYYIEFGSPCTVRAQARPGRADSGDDGTVTVDIVLAQGDRTAAAGNLQLLVGE